jgi:hypothetical protein
VSPWSAPITGFYFTWVPENDGDGTTTTSGYCNTDVGVCDMPVWGDGRMDIEVTSYNGSVYNFAHVSVALPATAPDGMTQEGWDQMNSFEKRECINHLWECVNELRPAVEAANAFAQTAAAQDGFPGDLIDNKYDAMRHAFWNAKMVRDMGANRATVWADLHEAGHSRTDPSTCMDLHNNAVGRQVATEMPRDSFSDTDVRTRIRQMADAVPPDRVWTTAHC